MDAAQLLAHYQTAKEKRIVLSFMGIVTQEIMVEYGKLIQQQEGLTLNSRQILFGTFIELAQNIIRYSAERAGPASGKERRAAIAAERVLERGLLTPRQIGGGDLVYDRAQRVRRGRRARARGHEGIELGRPNLGPKAKAP